MRLHTLRIICLLGLIMGVLMGCQPITRPPETGGGSSSAEDPGQYTLSGEIRRGQTLELEMANDLVLWLVPYGEDWELQVSPRIPTGDQPAPDYGLVVTPPFRSLNSRQIQGWHFRNADNSGPNQAGADSVNAPQEVRHFCYVLDSASYARAFTRFFENGDALAGLEDIQAAGAILTIEELELGNLVTGEQAWIESMQFRLEYGEHIPCSLFN
ncbi:MAG: hypothetical protein WDZ49_17300 [Litorilinea sp.]